MSLSSSPDTVSRDPAATPLATPAEPHFSLLRLSAGQRLIGVSAALALLWLAVWWAL